MKKLFTLIFLAAVAFCASAAPVKNMPAVRVQPNGDTLRCFVSGDEFFHRLHDADGYTIVQDPETGYFVYADLSDDGLLVPTAYRPGKDIPAKAGLRPGLMPSAKELRRLRAAWDIPDEYREPAPKRQSWAFTRLNNIVIFVRFSDESALGTQPFSTYSAMFNDSTGGTISMYSYFRRASYGNLTLPTYFYPVPSGSTVLSYQDSLPRSYYQPYDATTNPNGYNGDTERRNREFGLLQRAVAWVNANSPVDTTINLDCDNDGKIDNICFVVSGTYTGWSGLLWPHKWSLYDRNVYINGKRVYTFNLQLAGSGSHYFSVGTFCHEMTHTLGAPDLYHYDDYTSVSPAGAWDLMCSNGSNPQSTNSLSRLKYMGWFDSIPLLTDSGTYTMTSLMSGPNHAYKIASADAHEWYILEYRNNADTCDQTIPGRGMLIWRYRDNAPSNADFDYFTNRHELWLFRPNSASDTIDGTPSQAAFGVNGRTNFNSATNPHPYLCNGTTDTSFTISNITIAQDYSYVTFTFNPRGGAACTGNAVVPMTMDFEDGSEGCWQAISANNANASNMGVITNHGSGSTIAPHGGNYQFRFSSYSSLGSGGDYRQYLISPRYQSTDPTHLQFYFRRTNSRTEYLRVLYSTTTRDTAAFTNQLASYTISQSGWQHADLLVPAAARYVALQYYSADQYYVLVDDITLRDTQIYIHDTTYITVHDTAYRTEHDTLYTTVHDTAYRTLYDTLYTTVVDTAFFTPVDTLDRWNVDTVIFTPSTFNLLILSNATGRGKVSGSGNFLQGTRVEIAAMPRAGYHFTRWQDNNTDNPRTILMTTNLTYTAYFDRDGAAPSVKDAELVHDTIYIHDTTWITLRDTITVALHDTTWLPLHDTITLTLHDTLWLPLDIHDTLWVDRDSTYILDTILRCTLSVRSSHPNQCPVAGSGFFPSGTVVSLGAIAGSGFSFVSWSDGSTELPHEVTVEGDMNITALFDGVGLDSPAAGAVWMAYSRDSRIVVSGAEGQSVTIYDALGRQVWSNSQLTTHNSQLTTPVLPDGLYLVKVGASAPAKVIVR